MPGIDDKVVSMSFESSKFEQGVNSAINALNKLKEALKFPEAGKGLDDINDHAKRLDFGFITKAIESVKNALGSLRLVAIGVLTHIANTAVDAGARMVKALTLDPIKQGLDIYQTKLQSIQTVLANTSAQGTKMQDVTKALDELNKYSNQTIYNFGQMAKNIGTFTAAGVDLKTSTAAIKGIANLAALSGSSADQASMAMYQLSQAIASGRVSLQDWNSVVNAGMGGAVFQKALAETAQAMGKLKDGSVQLVGPMKQLKINGESFRESIGGPGPKWLTSDVLTTTLKNFTGDLSDAQLKAEGFNEAQIKSIQTTAKIALHAATQVKTIGQVFDIAKETAATGWASTFEIIFGGLNEAKATFTALSNAINGFIQTSADARNKVLGDWKALGGRTILINAIKTAFENLGQILKPIKQAFRDIFPPTTGKDLLALTKRFKELADALKPSPETIDNLRRTFRGLFALLDIGKQIIGGIFTVFSKLFGAIGDGSGGFLSITAKIGDFLTAVDKALKDGGRLHNFFVQLGDVLAKPIEFIVKLRDALINMFSGFSSGGISKQMGGLNRTMSPLQKLLTGITNAWDKFVAAISGANVQPAVDAIVQLIQGLGTAIGNAASNINFDAILSVIRTGLFGALVVMFKNFLGKGTLADQLGGLGGGIIKNIAGTFDALRGSMVAIQNNIKAQTLKQIAIAVGILTASIVALSFVNPDKLKSALAGITVAFGELLGAMALLDKVGKSGGFIKLPFIAGSLILLAGAIDILSIAIIAMSKLSWEDLAKGLGAVGALLGGIAIAVKPISASSGGMIRAGIGITAIAISLNILALAVKQFAGMDWASLGKGLFGVGAGLTALVLAMNNMPSKGMLANGIALIAIAGGLRLLANAVTAFGGMDMRTIGQGMLGIGAGLVIVAGAMRLMPKNMVVQAAGLALVALSLGKIADAVAKMGGMSLSSLAKGLGGLAGALILLAGALILMDGSAGGAAALTIAAFGVSMLADALVKMGKLSWGEILKSMITLAGALAVLAGAAILLTPVIPSLIGLGAALVLIGGGLALAGAGIALIGVGLSAIAVAGPTAVGILVAALIQLSEAIPKVVQNVVSGLLSLVQQLAKVAPQFVDALIKILNSLLDAIIGASPKIAEAFNALISLAIKVLGDNQGKIIQAGYNLLIALLQGIKNNLPQLVNLVGDIIARFLGGIANNLNKIITAGVSVLTSLVKGIAQNIVSVATTAVDIVVRFLNAIANNYARIVTAGASILTKLLSGIANSIQNVISSGVDIVVAFVKGVGQAGSRIVSAGTNAIIKLINALSSNGVKLANAGMEAIVNFLNGVATAINTHSGEMRQAGWNVGIAIVDGMTGGLLSKAQGLYNQITGIMSHAMSIFHKIPIVHSPSQVTYDIGENIMLGLMGGMDSNAKGVYSSAEEISYGLINTFKTIFQISSPSKTMYDLGKFVGQGFAQGLKGSQDDIRSAFQDLNNKLTDAMQKAGETIATEQAKLNKLREANKPDAEAIAAAQKTIEENQALLLRASQAHDALTGVLKGEKSELIGLAGEYDKITQKLKDAQSALQSAIETRDQAIKQFTDQYSTLPAITTEDAQGNAIDQLAAYEDALKHQADAVGAYDSTLQQLRKLGLDDATMKKLVDDGTMDQAFADQLLAGGKTAVDALNTLDKNLQTVSKTLATNAGQNLYQAGVDAAQGLVNGLKSKQSEIRQTMTDIAREILNTLKKELKIKSPSQEFAEIGAYSMEGFALGFSDSSKMVTDAVDAAGKDALSAMQESMRNINDVIASTVDPQLVLTPVLDLTQVKAQSQELSSLASVTPITASASYGQASVINSQQNAAQAEEATIVPGGTSVKFEQNNYSPVALSEIEIYRQTKNQLSQMKSALALN